MALFEVGKQFPPKDEVERLALYQSMIKVYEGDYKDIFKRVNKLLENSPYKDQMDTLFLSCNMADVIATKPSELLLSEEPVIDSPKASDSLEQIALSRLSQENDLKQMVFDLTVGAAIRGDMFLKVIHNYRQDFSELKKLANAHGGIDVGALLEQTKPEVLMQTIPAEFVFPEIGSGVGNSFKAVNIAYIEWVKTNDNNEDSKIPFLVVERHLPYFIEYKRFEMRLKYVNDQYHDAKIPVYDIIREVETGKAENLVFTNVEVPLVFQFTYKKNDFKWWGTGMLEKVSHLIVAIADRLTSIDFILNKHSDPILTGPALLEGGDMVRMAGAYISRTNEDPEIKYVTWDGKLDAAFKELDILISKVFFQAQLPSWLFGSGITDANRGGQGLSHTDGSAVRLRYAPVSALLDRLNSNIVKTLGDAFYYAQVLENYTMAGTEGFSSYVPTYPLIQLSDGVPVDEAEETTNVINRVNAGLMDKISGIKKLDGVDDVHAQEMLDRIEEEQKKLDSWTTTDTVFNGNESSN